MSLLLLFAGGGPGGGGAPATILGTCVALAEKPSIAWAFDDHPYDGTARDERPYGIRITDEQG